VSQPCDIIAYDRNGHELMKDDIVCVHPERWIGSLASVIEGRCLVIPANSSPDDGGIVVDCASQDLAFVSR
jgi:hypothetical protein